MEYCFYLDWTGWAPEVWAAWTQAILSAVAIFAAAHLATRQERLALRRRADACVGLITHAQDVLQDVVVNPSSVTSRARVQSLGKTLQEVTIDNAPDFRLVIAVRKAGMAINALAAKMDNRALAAFSETHRNRELRPAVKAAHAELQEAYEEAISVANGLVRRTFKQRFNQWKLDRSQRKEELVASDGAAENTP